MGGGYIEQAWAHSSLCFTLYSLSCDTHTSLWGTKASQCLHELIHQESQNTVCYFIACKFYLKLICQINKIITPIKIYKKKPILVILKWIRSTLNIKDYFSRDPSSTMGEFTWMPQTQAILGSIKRREQCTYSFQFAYRHDVRIEARPDGDDINSVIIVLPRYCQGTIRYCVFFPSLDFVGYEGKTLSLYDRRRAKVHMSCGHGGQYNH